MKYVLWNMFPLLSSFQVQIQTTMVGACIYLSKRLPGPMTSFLSFSFFSPTPHLLITSVITWVYTPP